MAKLNINGQVVEVTAADDTPLLWAIRDHVGLTGTKYGCGIAACGACTVHIDGQAVRSCSMPLSAVSPDQKIVTIEGLSPNGMHPIQVAWRDLDVPQCGYCQSGQVMSAVGLLSENPKPSVEEIDDYMAGNACRCATYQRIRAGIQRASEILEA